MVRDVTAALGGRLAFGGDYNPEQWPRETWREDVALMRQAGVNLVSLGVFSWAVLEPAEGHYDFGLLDEVLPLLHEAGVRVDLATATASPPAWFSRRYPHTLLTDDHGVQREFGARQSYCPSAPEFRAAATALAGRLAERYADHPAVVMWHVGNEYGCHDWHCFCEVSAAAFRDWLQRRYADLDALNEAWGTAFWSQRYTAWDQIAPPRAVAYRTFANPGQQLDWWRFGSDELLSLFQAEARAVRAHSSKPLTTNFMSFFTPLDYRSWARSQDGTDYVVSNDDYLIGEDPDPTQRTAMAADLMRSLSRGAPWLLMEHSTSAVNWQPRNLAKAPGQLRRNSLQHVARGADGALFFQWRASRAGAEKYHSGLVPHAGTDSKVWREVVELGRTLGSIAEVAGSRVAPSPVGLLFDWTSWWAAGLDSHPSVDVDPYAELRRWHAELYRRNVGVDVVGPEDDLSSYRVVVVPAQYLLTDAAATALRAAAEGGATVVATYFSGIVDEHDHVRLGGYPGALRDLLGVRVEEFVPLPEGGTATLSAFGPGTVWSELSRAEDAEVLATFADGWVAGSPAVTRRPVGSGSAWYVATALGPDGVRAVLDRVLTGAGVRATADGLPAGVEAVLRVSGDGPDERSWLFVLNHTAAPVPLPVGGTELVTGREVVAGRDSVPAGGVAVVREG